MFGMPQWFGNVLIAIGLVFMFAGWVTLADKPDDLQLASTATMNAQSWKRAAEQWEDAATKGNAAAQHAVSALRDCHQLMERVTAQRDEAIAMLKEVKLP